MLNSLSKTVVIHQAALGDFVLIWPFVRRLGVHDVTLVTEAEKARMASRYLHGLYRAVSIESRLWNSLWNSDGPDETLIGTHVGVEALECFIAKPGSIWDRNAQLVFPNARITYHATKPPVRVEEPEYQPGVRVNPDGPIVMHVGAGSDAKRWPVARSVELAGVLTNVVMVAGEAERESFSYEECRAFHSAGGRFCETLDVLCDVIEQAGLFIGFDSGPTHLAAQIGIPTLALFGPTDPEVWSPIGPSVRVMAQDTPAEMDWLTPAVVFRVLQD